MPFEHQAPRMLHYLEAACLHAARRHEVPCLRPYTNGYQKRLACRRRPTISSPDGTCDLHGPTDRQPASMGSTERLQSYAGNAMLLVVHSDGEVVGDISGWHRVILLQRCSGEMDCGQPP